MKYEKNPSTSKTRKTKEVFVDGHHQPKKVTMVKDENASRQRKATRIK